MIRVLLLSLLLAPGPLAAQRSAADVPPLRGGTPVRVFLKTDSLAGAAGVLVSGTPDTLRVASPALGLVRLSAADLQRLEIRAGRGSAWKYPAYVVALSGAAAVISPPEDFSRVFVGSLMLFGMGGGAAYLLEPPRRSFSIDPRLGLPEVRQDPARPGVLVRIDAGSQPRATLRMHDFTADSLYLVAEGRSTPVARTEIRSLQVSMGRDRRSGAVWGGRIGAAAGAAAAVAFLAGERSEGAYLLGPFVVGMSGGLGWLVGAPTGWVLGPRKWQDVPLQPPAR